MNDIFKNALKSNSKGLKTQVSSRGWWPVASKLTNPLKCPQCGGTRFHPVDVLALLGDQKWERVSVGWACAECRTVQIVLYSAM